MKRLEFTEVDLDWVLDQTTKTIKENKDAPIRALIVEYWNNRLSELIKPLEEKLNIAEYALQQVVDWALVEPIGRHDLTDYKQICRTALARIREGEK